MSINQGERFSNDRYLTMNQVSRTLGTTLIDDIWKEVLQYRNAFMSTLSLRTVERNRLKVVLTPKISDRMNQLDRRMTRIQTKINELSLSPHYDNQLKTLLNKEILKTVANSYGITFNEAIVSQLINNSISVLTPREMFLNDYYRGLELVVTAQWLSFDEKLIAEIGRLFNAPPLNNYIYRTTEIKTSRQIALINYIHQHVPTNQITDMVTDLIKFVNESELPTIILSAVIIFYLDYIKPFETHSEIIAILLAKSFLAQRELAFLAPFINFELLLERFKENRDEIFSEVKKSSDVTYFIDLLINILNESLEAVENHVNQVLTHEIEAEKHAEDPAEEVTVEEPSPTDLFAHALAEEKKAAKPIPVYVPKEGAVNLPKDETVVRVSPQEANLGISELPPQLSENDILRLERHLRESDASLSKAESFFYARHCTMGKYYTINDFKEVTGCAYETARTSMDHLANSGYYRKEKFKNKFIYTPNKKA